MTLCFLVYRYFPHGGQQRDFMRIALACQARGYRIRVYTLRWEGEMPDGFDVRLVQLTAFSRPRLYRKYQSKVAAALAREPADLVIGFSRMPGLDVYYGADPCFAHRAHRDRGWYYPYTGRYRHFVADEQAVFGAGSRTLILLLTTMQQQQYLNYYPDAVPRMRLLPPGLDRNRGLPDDALAQREGFRREMGLADDELAIVQVGSGFAVKGVDRSILAIDALPDDIRRRCHFYIAGQGKPGRFRRLAQNSGIEAQCHFTGGRNDVQRFLLGADLMLHPAHSESAGMVLLEALVCGLPVLTTDTCGYASHVRDADAGIVCKSPFSQQGLNDALQSALASRKLRADWRQNALDYCAERDLHGLVDAAVDHIENRLRSPQKDEESDDTVSA